MQKSVGKKVQKVSSQPQVASPQPRVAQKNLSTSGQYLPLISVIIPVYNVAKLLERCVESVLRQVYPNLEIILIDDGSTDMSGAFCDVFAKKDQRVKVIRRSQCWA